MLLQAALGELAAPVGKFLFCVRELADAVLVLCLTVLQLFPGV